jgi:hypothetical protein
MAVYKVIQDVESEDKLLGPLTFKGLVYAMIAAFLAFIEFRTLVSGAPVPIKLVIFITLLFPIILFAVLASPLGRDQPTEVWLLSYIKFFFQPRKRLWDQSGLKHLVTITAPKKLDKHLTKDFTQKEVDSRLKALALTLDSRGWAIKNVNVNLDDEKIGSKTIKPTSDRLVHESNLHKNSPPIDVKASDDIMDAESNPTAKKFDHMMKQADIDKKHELIRKVKKDSFNKDDLRPLTSDVNHDHKKAARRKLAAKPLPTDVPAPTGKVTASGQTDKLELIKTAKDYNYKISTVANLASRAPKVIQIGPGEVEIDLH